MAAGREAEDSDALGIQAPFGGAMADYAHGALGVLQGRAVPRQARAHRHAILHQRAIDTEGIEPLAHLRALQVHGEDAVAAARKDDDRGAGVCGRGRAVKRHGRVTHRAQADHRFPGDQAIGGFGGVLFRAEASLFSRRSSGPERDGSGIGGREGCRDEDKKAGEFAHKFAGVPANRVARNATPDGMRLWSPPQARAIRRCRRPGQLVFVKWPVGHNRLIKTC